MAFLVAGCAGRAVVDESAAPPEEIGPPVEIVTAPPPAPDPVLAACESLLQRLETTEPLLAGIDDSLQNQADRFDAAIATLNQPAPEPQALVCPPDTNSVLGDKQIIGGIEWLYIDPPGQHFQARVDSGAETSSMTANDVVEFERDGDDWVRFTFQHETADEPVEFELPVKRTVLIRHVASETPDRRYVVELDVRLGEILQTTEFTLTDRGNMTHPITLGRAFLMDLYVVDVSSSFLHERYDAT